MSRSTQGVSIISVWANLLLIGMCLRSSVKGCRRFERRLESLKRSWLQSWLCTGRTLGWLRGAREIPQSERFTRLQKPSKYLLQTFFRSNLVNDTICLCCQSAAFFIYG